MSAARLSLCGVPAVANPTLSNILPTAEDCVVDLDASSGAAGSASEHFGLLPDDDDTQDDEDAIMIIEDVEMDMEPDIFPEATTATGAQGTEAELEQRDLFAELEAKEAKHFDDRRKKAAAKIEKTPFWPKTMKFVVKNRLLERVWRAAAEIENGSPSQGLEFRVSSLGFRVQEKPSTGRRRIAPWRPTGGFLAGK